jgi:hypothetical protein
MSRIKTVFITVLVLVALGGNLLAEDLSAEKTKTSETSSSARVLASKILDAAREDMLNAAVVNGQLVDGRYRINTQEGTPVYIRTTTKPISIIGLEKEPITIVAGTALYCAVSAFVKAEASSIDDLRQLISAQGNEAVR